MKKEAERYSKQKMVHKQVEKFDFDHMVHIPVCFLRHQWRARKRE